MAKKKITYEKLRKAVNVFRTDMIRSVISQGESVPVFQNKECHLNITRVNNPLSTISSDNEYIFGYGTISFDIELTISSGDTIIVDKINAKDGSLLARYTGVCGTPIIMQSRKECSFSITGVEQNPTPYIPTEEVLVPYYDYYLNTLFFYDGYKNVSIDGNVVKFIAGFTETAATGYPALLSYLANTYRWYTLPSLVLKIKDGRTIMLTTQPSKLNNVWTAEFVYTDEYEVFITVDGVLRKVTSEIGIKVSEDESFIVTGNTSYSMFRDTTNDVYLEEYGLYELTEGDLLQVKKDEIIKKFKIEFDTNYDSPYVNFPNDYIYANEVDFQGCRFTLVPYVENIALNYYSFDNLISTDTSVVDDSGHENDMTLLTDNWSLSDTDKFGFGKAMQITASTETLATAPCSGVNGDLSICLWFNASSVATTGQYFIDSVSMGLRLVANKVSFVWKQNSTTFSRYTFTANTDYFVAVRGSGTKKELFVNGVKVDEVIISPSQALDSTFITLFGRRSTDAVVQFPYDGFVDEIQIFNKALTDAEIADIYQDGGAKV